MADELTAQQRFTCPLCGGEEVWDPKRQTLVCAYCGNAMPATQDATTGAIQEHPLAAALRDVPDAQRGWDTQTHTVRCQSCQAITVFPAGVVAQQCAFCGSSALVDYQELRAPIRPESLLPFKIAETQVREAARAWYQSRWFAPNQLKRAALTDRVHGFYLPFWTFDAQAHCRWTAEAGYHYYETESYTDSDGKSQSRQVQRTRWEPASGAVDYFFDDKLVAASKGVASDLIRRIEPFPTKDELKPYAASFLSGWVVEQYQIDLGTAVDEAKAAMRSELQDMCEREVPGDTQRGLSIDPEYSGETYKHILLPVWLLTYNYLGAPYQMIVNGYTATVAGRYPKSWIKITFLVLAILIVLISIYAIYARGR